MNSLATLIAPLALLLPAPLDPPVAAEKPPEDSAQKVDDAVPQSPPGWQLVADAFRIPNQSQVRIQRQVTVRIAPRSQPMRNNLLATLPQAELEKRYESKKMGKCVSLTGIAGVQVDRDNRLLLFMRDRRIVRASLNKKCNARDFYSGFYVKQRKDGDICVERDELKSRAGSTCEITKLRRLVPIRQ